MIEKRRRGLLVLSGLFSILYLAGFCLSDERKSPGTQYRTVLR